MQYRDYHHFPENFIIIRTTFVEVASASPVYLLHEGFPKVGFSQRAIQIEKYNKKSNNDDTDERKRGVMLPTVYVKDDIILIFRTLFEGFYIWKTKILIKAN